MNSGKIITVDQGNSSSKAVLWEGLTPVKAVRQFHADIEGLLPLFEEGEPEGCVYCSVGHNDAKFLETLRRISDGNLMVLTPSTPLPFKVEYGTRETLGNDRVAAAAGAAMLFPGEGVLIADTGTALTLDVLTADGVFSGGNISPGIQLRFETLRAHTSRLPLVKAEGPLPDFGTDTETAIRAGVVRGTVAEIEAAFHDAQRLHGATRLVLAGSDALFLEPLLRERGLAPETVPNLVGIGLLAIFRHNNDNNQDSGVPGASHT